MTTLIIIAQTYVGAMAYEFGPYPDVDSCEKSAIHHKQEIEAGGQVLKVISDCRVLYPELNQSIELSDVNDID